MLFQDDNGSLYKSLGYNFQIAKQQINKLKRKCVFAAIINPWNSLTKECVKGETLNKFKSR